jgi:hypothetical protein
VPWPQSSTLRHANRFHSLSLWVLGDKINVHEVKNKASDTLYEYFKESKDERLPKKIPNLEDVQYIFANSKSGAKIRDLMIVHTVFHFFSASCPTELPKEWKDMLTGNGEIGWEIMKMIREWGWNMGDKVPAMRLRKCVQFHEFPEGPIDLVKDEPAS